MVYHAGRPARVSSAGLQPCEVANQRAWRVADWLDSKPQFLRHRCTRDGVYSALHRGVQPTRAGRSGIALLVMGGIGIVLAGLFPWKMVDGVPTETPPHVIGAIMAFAAAGLGLIVFSRRMTADPDGVISQPTRCTRGSQCSCYSSRSDSLPSMTVRRCIRGPAFCSACCVAVWFACMIVLAVRLRNISGRP